MSTATSVRTDTTLDSKLLARTIEEGYGSGAWHGPDLKAALSDVTSDMAFWRPGPGRHNIAEIALHHAYFVRSVRGQLSELSALGSRLSAASAPEPFVLEGEDWFELSESGPLTWAQIREVVDSQQRQLAQGVAQLGAPGGRRQTSPDVEPFRLVLGITCHAVYHAGQIQLIKRLHEG